MSDFEMLSIVLMILSIIVTILLHILINQKSKPPLSQRIAVTFL